jgi:hypothetical protein
MKLVPIKKKKIYTYKGNVYDLNVNNDHTYNIDGNIVHNSDYVMAGSIFNKAMESAGFNYLKTFLGRIRIKNYDLARWMWKWGFPIYKKYRGMSTKAVQRSWGKTKLVTAEGITKYQKVEYTLHQWVENFRDYFSSNMSYSGAKNLEDFIGNGDWVFITERARKRFEK